MTDDIQLYEGDCRELIKDVPDKSVDLIFTDLPYIKKYMYLYEWLAHEGLRVLKDDGFLMAYTGAYWKDFVMTIFANHYDYFYDFIIQHNGNTTILWSRGLISGYKSILCYTKKGEKLKPAQMGVLGLFSGTGGDKRFHKWGQPEHESRYYISCFSRKEELVLDPFMGSGTTGVVCKRLKRRFIGFEIEKKTFDIARDRMDITGTPEEYEQKSLAL